MHGSNAGKISWIGAPGGRAVGRSRRVGKNRPSDGRPDGDICYDWVMGMT